MKNLIMIFCVMFLISGSTLAQQERGTNGKAGNRNPNGQQMRRQGEPKNLERRLFEDKKRMAQLRMFKLLDLLELDEETEPFFITQVRLYHNKMGDILKNQQQVIRKLGKGLKEQTMNDQEIEDKINTLDRLEKQRQKIEAEFRKRSKEILTTEQLGKLYVFQVRFGAELFEKMKDFRREHGGGFRGQNSDFNRNDFGIL